MWIAPNFGLFKIFRMHADNPRFLQEKTTKGYFHKLATPFARRKHCSAILLAGPSANGNCNEMLASFPRRRSHHFHFTTVLVTFFSGFPFGIPCRVGKPQISVVDNRYQADTDDSYMKGAMIQKAHSSSLKMYGRVPNLSCKM